VSDVAALIADLVRAGVDPDLIGRTAAALASREPVKIVDEQAERKRAADRERMRAKREEDRAMSRDIAEQSPSDKEIPQTPKEINSPRSDPKGSSLTPRKALETVLDAERASAVIDHRKRLGKPLTAHAAKLLADKLAQWPDPNFAADEMISNGWQGFKPEWLESRQSPQHRATAPPERTVSDALADISAGRWPLPRQEQDHEHPTIETSFFRRN